MLRDKVAIITGGSSGIGRAIAFAFAHECACLVLASRTASELEAAKQELESLPGAQRVEVLPTDVSKPEDVGRLVDFTLTRFSTIDILVNCAGIWGPIGLAADVDGERWMQAVNINLCGTFLCTGAVLPTMMAKRKGKIVNLSGGGATSPFPRFSAYSASKAGIVRLTETLAEEVKEHSIDINAIAPGAVDTRLLDQVVEAGDAAGTEYLDLVIKRKRDGCVSPEQVAELAVFLASSESDGLTGRIISLLWDSWREIPQRLERIMSSDIYTMRRIVPSDRGYEW